MAEFNSKKRVRDDSDELFDSGFYSPEVKRLREDLLENFDDGEFYTASHELDSFMKSFEEEISSGSAANTAPAPAVVDLTSETGESQPELGYLLEASDDELGLPPSTSEGRNGNEVEEKTELVRGESDSAELSGGLWGYGEELPSYDSLDVGIGEFGDFNNGGGEYVALDGLFDYDFSYLGFGSGYFPLRPETLPAE